MSKNFRYTEKSKEVGEPVVEDNAEEYANLDKPVTSTDSSVESAPNVSKGDSVTRTFSTSTSRRGGE